MRRMVILVIGVLMWVTTAAPALADHTHVRATGNGSCVILAADGREKEVQLPHAGDFVQNRRHPLHVKVHMGEPGTRHGVAVMWVYKSATDPCTGYVND